MYLAPTAKGVIHGASNIREGVGASPKSQYHGPVSLQRKSGICLMRSPRGFTSVYPVAKEAMRRGYYMPNRGSIHCVVISVHIGAAVSRILAASWNREGIPAPHVEVKRSASLLTACIVFEVAPGDPNKLVHPI
jgi:hypothetical protein